jgi:hypothetical protein
MGTLATLIVFVTVFSATCGAVQLDVMVLNYAHLDDVETTVAHKEAARLLAAARIVIRWLPPDPDQPPLPGSILLNILPEAMARRWPHAGESCGYALLRTAGIFYHCVDRELAKYDPSPVERGRFLGYLIAHELGHLLIGPGVHSGGGIMKAHWGYKEVQWIRQGSLLFMPFDVVRMHNGLAARRGDLSALRTKASQ